MSLLPAHTTDLTRRQLLIAAGGIGLAAFLQASPARSDTPDAARLATLAALLGAVACGPAAGMTDAVASAYVERFAASYAGADPHFRAYADGALDEIGATGIRLLDAPAGYAELQSWANDGRHAARAAAALDLTNLAFEDDDSRQAGYALTRS
jgi:hypothetical protein